MAWVVVSYGMITIYFNISFAGCGCILLWWYAGGGHDDDDDGDDDGDDDDDDDDAIFST